MKILLDYRGVVSKVNVVAIHGVLQDSVYQAWKAREGKGDREKEKEVKRIAGGTKDTARNF